MHSELKKRIESDIYRIAKGEKRLILQAKLHFTHPALKYLRVYRKAKYYSDAGNKLLAGWFSWRLYKLSLRYGYQINRHCNIGYGVYLGHRGSVVVNGEAVLGNNVNLANGVVIGAEVRGARKGCPRIGDSVWIGANSVVVGKITIGNNVLIAPNTYVNFDVPSDSIVMGSPGKIRHNDRATDCYIQNPYHE